MMQKQIIASRDIIVATGKASDFPSLSQSRPLKGWWDSRRDVYADFLAIKPRHSGLSEQHARNVLNGDV